MLLINVSVELVEKRLQERESESREELIGKNEN
jgi:ribose 1,5-bisphosphokinase PhnN